MVFFWCVARCVVIDWLLLAFMGCCCVILKVKSTSSLGSTKSEKATDLWSAAFIHSGSKFLL